MSISSCIADAAAKFRHRLLTVPGVLYQPTSFQVDSNDSVLWDNLLLSSPAFRHGHVETFEIPGRLSVLHVCVFPETDDASPIFGFDMIAGPNKVTGLFLDLSGVLDNVPVPSLRDIIDCSYLSAFSERRNLPEWGTVFSADMLAIRPVDLDELKLAIDFGHQALDGLLLRPRVRSEASSAAISAGQQRYVEAQRRNDHTFRMLANLIGKESARQFIDQVLFPPVPGQVVDKAKLSIVEGPHERGIGFPHHVDGASDVVVLPGEAIAI